MVRTTRTSTLINRRSLFSGRRVTTTPRIGLNRQGYLRLEVCLPLLLLSLALGSMIIWVRYYRPANSGLVVPTGSGGGGRPPREWMSSDLFEERIRTHYQKEHGDTATNYVKNRETKEKLILKFVDLASEDDLSQCVALTGILFSGFCPPDLTNRVADLADYPGPGTQANLNEWVKQIEGLKIRIKVRLGKDVLEKTEFLDWWILFCGVLEEFNSKTAKRCRDDLRIPVIRLLPKQTVLESLKRNMHWIVGSVQQAPLETRLLSGLFDHLTDYVKVLPDHFKDIDFKYSGEYVSFVRNLYRTRPGVASGADFDRLCFEEVEVYLKGLMSKRSLEVLEFEFE